MRSRLGAYGYDGRFDGNVVMDLSFEDIADDERWNAALERTTGRFANTGTTALLNGCSAVEVAERKGVSMELGAATESMGSYQGHASVAAPDKPLVTWGVVVWHALSVAFGGVHG